MCSCVADPPLEKVLHGDLGIEAGALVGQRVQSPEGKAGAHALAVAARAAGASLQLEVVSVVHPVEVVVFEALWVVRLRLIGEVEGREGRHQEGVAPAAVDVDGPHHLRGASAPVVHPWLQGGVVEELHHLGVEATAEPRVLREMLLLRDLRVAHVAEQLEILEGARCRPGPRPGCGAPLGA
jgi:hypothetical protein